MEQVVTGKLSNISYLTMDMRIISCLGSNKSLWGTKHCKLEVIGGWIICVRVTAEELGVIGRNSHRLAIAKSIEAIGLPLINAIHPSAFIMPSAES
jgi:hypothetical protein